MHNHIIDHQSKIQSFNSLRWKGGGAGMYAGVRPNSDENRPINWGKEVIPQQHIAEIANHEGNYPTGTQNPLAPSLR